MDIIYDVMKFIDYKDFYDKRCIIKDSFNDLSYIEKKAYKMYVYSNVIEREFKLDKIWEYLNEPCDSEFYIDDEDLKKYI